MDRAQADDVLLETTQNGKAIDQALIDHGNRGRRRSSTGSSPTRLGTEVVDLDTVEFTPKILRAISRRAGAPLPHRAPSNGARRRTRSGSRLIDPLDTQTIDDPALSRWAATSRWCLPPRQQIRERLKKHYGDDTSSMEEILKQLGEIGEVDDTRLRRSDGHECRSRSERPPRSIRFVDSDLVSGDPRRGERHSFRAVRG